MRPRGQDRSNLLGFALLVALLTFFLCGSSRADQADPLENINRPVHEFNTVVDSLIFRPLAVTYKALTPRFVKIGINNVLSNLDDVAVTANDLLQGKFDHAMADFGRVVINSTLGIGGIFDVAGTAFELEKHEQNFGQTLAHWGMERGPYIVIPLLGPSTTREGIGGITNLFLNPGLGSDKSSIRDKSLALNGVSGRAELLAFEALIVGDEYLFVRELYLQRLKQREAVGDSLDAFAEF